MQLQQIPVHKYPIYLPALQSALYTSAFSVDATATGGTVEFRPLLQGDATNSTSLAPASATSREGRATAGWALPLGNVISGRRTLFFPAARCFMTSGREENLCPCGEMKACLREFNVSDRQPTGSQDGTPARGPLFNGMI